MASTRNREATLANLHALEKRLTKALAAERAMRLKLACNLSAVTALVQHLDDMVSSLVARPKTKRRG